MKVIARKNDSENEVFKIECPNCGCTVEYNEYDLEDFDHGTGFYCPDCGQEIYHKRFNTHQFPEAFYHFGVGKDSVTLDDKEVQKYVDEVAKQLDNCNIGSHYYIGSGDTMVIGFKYEDEDHIIVAKNYWEEEYDIK